MAQTFTEDGHGTQEHQQTSTQELLEHYIAVNSLAEKILADKQQIVELEVRRNKCREATRELKKFQSSKKGSKCWTCFGNTFLKMDTTSSIAMLQTDQATIQDEVAELRDGLKPQVEELHRLEGKAEPKGFTLQGMSTQDLTFLHQQQHS